MQGTPLFDDFGRQGLNVTLPLAVIFVSFPVQDIGDAVQPRLLAQRKFKWRDTRTER